jgi:hypothetical protein
VITWLKEILDQLRSNRKYQIVFARSQEQKFMPALKALSQQPESMTGMYIPNYVIPLMGTILLPNKYPAK